MRSNNHNIFTYIFILVVIALIAGAIYIVYYSKNNSDETVEENEIVENNEDEIAIVENFKMGISDFDTMNPILTRNREIINLQKLIFEPLVSINQDYKTENCLAKSVEKKSDNVYEIKIDTSIKWQDGTPLIARDVAFTIEKIKEYNSIYISNVQSIQSVETPDSETVIITLDYPIPFFEYNLNFPIISNAYYINEDFANSNKIPIGTGMYKIASIDEDNIFLIKNDRWRKVKETPPKTQSITIHKYSAVGEIFNGFKLGNIDTINTYMTNYTDYVGTMGYNKIDYAGREYDFLSINCNDAILGNTAVRQAIAYAINKEAIVSSAFANTKMPAYSPLDYGSYLYSDSEKISYNQDLAKKVLTEDGWTYTSGSWQKNIDGYVKKINVSIAVNQDHEDRIKVANIIKSQLEDIGIKINVVKVNNERYESYLNNKNYQILFTGVTNSINPDLNYFCGRNNLANYYNEEIFDNINSLDKYKEIQGKLNSDVPYIGLYRNKGTVILNANVGGNFKPNNYFSFYNFAEWFRQQ